MFKKFVCCAVVGLLAVGVLTGLCSAEKIDTVKPNKSPSIPSPKIYFPSSPIRINSDAEFTGMFSNRTIWGLEIDGTAKGFCIFIGNCSLPFIVKDCHLFKATGRNDKYYGNTGLILYESSNGTLTNNLCSTNDGLGILLHYSNTNTVAGNNCSGNTYTGIGLDNSNTNKLTNNTCSANYWNYGISLQYSNTNKLAYNICNGSRFDGIYLDYSSINIVTDNNCSGNAYGIELVNSLTNTFKRNIMYGCGMFFTCLGILYYNTQRIDTTNLVNGKSIHYLKNQTSGIIPPGAGQVILANCSHITVDKQTMVNCSVGILVAYSKDCTLSNNDCNKNHNCGIELTFSILQYDY